VTVTNLLVQFAAHKLYKIRELLGKRGTCEQWIKEGKGAIKWTRLSCHSFAANAVRLQLHALAYNLGIPAHAGDARGDQRLVADEPERKVDQDRGEGHQPRPLCRLPDGRGRHSEKSVRRHSAADCGVTTAAHYIDSVTRSVVMRPIENYARLVS
jgi:Transposase DDE domain group 1